MLSLKPCPKAYTADQDKAATPWDTVSRAKSRLIGQGASVLSEIRRIDTGRLDIPVFMSVTTDEARKIMPTRKQMGKGASPDQAEASALMELVERYSFFSYFEEDDNFQRATWSQAEARFDGNLMPLAEVLQSVGEDLPEDQARRVMDLVSWHFAPATNLGRDTERAVPLDWFKTLNEFNGSSAGNTLEESVFQGACELVERHVCANISRTEAETPTIDHDSCRKDPVLAELLDKFTDNGIEILLKDFTMDMPAPTVAVLCVDPATFPEMSEMVFTAGTAASPAKAAIRALTEAAQLGGDFETGANYEASGLPKFTDPDQVQWLEAGPVVSLDSLPSLESSDILDEIGQLCRGLSRAGYELYSLETTHPGLGIPANYNFVPGFNFRERAQSASLGLFVGRKLAEEADPEQARKGLDVLGEIYSDASFVPFFRGLAALKEGDLDRAASLFAKAEPGLEDAEDRAMAAFYQAYALTLEQDWEGARPHLDRALEMCPEVKEYFNLRGVAFYKSGDYEAAAGDFKAALDLDSGSAMDLANLGLCYKFMDQPEKAVHCLGSALQLDPALDFARTHLEEILAG